MKEPPLHFQGLEGIGLYLSLEPQWSDGLEERALWVEQSYGDLNFVVQPMEPSLSGNPLTFGATGVFLITLCQPKIQRPISIFYRDLHILVPKSTSTRKM